MRRRAASRVIVPQRPLPELPPADLIRRPAPQTRIGDPLGALFVETPPTAD